MQTKPTENPANLPAPDETTLPVPPDAQPKPEETVEYWKQQFNGKNGTAIKLQRQYEATLARATAAEERLSVVEVEAAAKVQTYEEQAKAAQAAAEKALAEAGKYAKASSVRAKLSSPEFKILADLYSEEEDILNLAVKYNDEELGTFLAKQAAKLSAFTKHTNEDRNLGSLPTPPPANNRTSAATDTKATSAALETAIAKGMSVNSPEYKKLFEEHIQAVMASSTQS